MPNCVVKTPPLVVLMCIAALSLFTLQPARVRASGQGIVTAAQVNGTWRSKNGEFKVWALGKQRLRVEFSGTYE